MNANFFSIMIPFSLISAFDRDDKWRWIQFLSFDDNKSNEIVGYSTIHQINISLDNIRNHNDKWNFIDQSCHVELSKNFLYEIDKPKKLWKSINEKFFSQECSSGYFWLFLVRFTGLSHQANFSSWRKLMIEWVTGMSYLNFFQKTQRRYSEMRTTAIQCVHSASSGWI